MSDYPPSNRRKRRYLVEWRKDDYVCTGFTENISPTGIFVRSTHIPKLGGTVSLKLLLPEGEKLRVRGTVVRSYLAPANLRRFIPSGYGVRLHEAPEAYFQLLARLFGLALLEKRRGRSARKLAS
jgi:Tfp pilus assembly protein PilZ